MLSIQKINNYIQVNDKTYSEVTLSEYKNVRGEFAIGFDDRKRQVFQVSEFNFKPVLVGGSVYTEYSSAVSAIATELEEFGTYPQILNYTHYQNTPAQDWTITHNLGRKPSVTILDDQGVLWFADIEHLDNNTLVISFYSSGSGLPLAGSAYLI